MVDGRRREDWSRTSALMALIANAHRDKKKQPTPYKPSDFDPLVVKQKVGVGVLKDLFIKDSSK